MSKGLRIAAIALLCAGGALLLAGAALFIVGLGLEGWDVTALNNAHYETRSYTAHGEIETVRIDYENAHIRIESGESFALSYPVRTDGDGEALAEVTVTEEDGALTVTEEDSFLQWGVGFGTKTPELVLTLPGKEYGAIVASSSAGSVTAEGISAAELTLRSDADAHWDAVVEIDATALEPQTTWGTNPGQECALTGSIPTLESFEDPVDREGARKALDYIGLAPGSRLTDARVDTVFSGSCTNGRIEDFREAAKVLAGRKVAEGVLALAVPGSMEVRRQAEAEGLDKIFEAAGFEWRLPGCSMCLAMNDDRAAPGSRVASTSNRNFVGRQGRGSRTHLMSPAAAAASAIEGRIADPRPYL